MADWLKKVVEEVDQQFKDLPEWKKTAQQDQAKCSLDDKKAVSTIREPRSK